MPIPRLCARELPVLGRSTLNLSRDVATAELEEFLLKECSLSPSGSSNTG